MKIKDLKTWLKTLPPELDECDMVFRKIKIIPGDEKNWAAHDKPITTCGIDIGNNEAYFCDDNSHVIINNN